MPEKQQRYERNNSQLQFHDNLTTGNGIMPDSIFSARKSLSCTYGGRTGDSDSKYGDRLLHSLCALKKNIIGSKLENTCRENKDLL